MPSIFTSLVDHWSLDNVLTGYRGNTWTNVGSAAFTAGGSGIGPHSQSIILNGSQSLQRADSAALSRAMGKSLSAVCWVKFTSLAATSGIFSKDDFAASVSREWNIYYDSGSTKIKSELYNDVGATVTLASTTTPVINTTYMLSLSYDFMAGMATLYFNAASQATIAMNNIRDTTAVLRVGGFTNSGAGASLLTGVVGQCILSDRAFSAADITYLYNAGAGRALATWTPPGGVVQELAVGA